MSEKSMSLPPFLIAFEEWIVSELFYFIIFCVRCIVQRSITGKNNGQTRVRHPASISRCRCPTTERREQ